jgi:hypothetical protein
MLTQAILSPAMVDEEPTAEPAPQAPEESNATEPQESQPQAAAESQGEAPAERQAETPAEPPAPKRADVLRDFRKTLADRQRPGGGKFNKPAGGNPRFR